MRPAERLAAIVRTAEASKLGRAEVREFPGLYRRTVSELAEARARGVPAAHLAQLEALVLRAHGLLYAPAPVRLERALGQLLLAFPSAVRKAWRYSALAAALLLAGAAWGYLEVVRDASNAAILLPGELQRNAEESFQAGVHVRDGDPLYGAFYFTNNARVALQAFALGATFGIGTVLSLLFNGAVIGATFAVVERFGSVRAFSSFVVPHGGVELAAIVIAAAGGLRIADGLLRPGWLRRREAFARAAREALPLALGAAALLVVAGVVEGWISPLDLPIATKALIGGTLDAGLALYLAKKSSHTV